MKYLLFLLLIGCASLTELEKEEREYREGMDAENWAACDKILSANHIITVHINHSHGPRSGAGPMDIRMDLLNYRCKRLLGEAWADY